MKGHEQSIWRHIGMQNPGRAIDHHLGLIPQNCIFHYTSHVGLLGILDKFSLWATNIHFLNDYMEFKGATETAIRIIDARRHSMQREVNYEQKWEPILHELARRVRSVETANLFIISFTECRDTLSQWRGYTSSSGASIGFQFEFLTKIAESQGFRPVKCLYDTRLKSTLIDLLINDILERWQGGVRHHRSLGNKPNVDALTDLADGFLQDFVSIAPAFKHESFDEEVEWRFVSPLLSNDDPRIKFRSARTLLIPYLELDLSHPSFEEGVLPIREIMVGPQQDRAQQTLTSHAVTLLLRHKRMKRCEVVCSRIPYRTAI